MSDQLPDRINLSTGSDNTSPHFSLSDLINDKPNGLPEISGCDPFENVPASSPNKLMAGVSDIAQTSSPHRQSMIIEQLRYGFVMAIQDPGFLSNRSSLSAAPLSSQEYIPAMSAAELAQYAALFPKHYSEEDIHDGPLTIARILDDFGEAVPDVFKQPEYEDVLMLFAGDLKPANTPALPELTRRDHHVLSLDSHVAFSQSTLKKDNDV